MSRVSFESTMLHTRKNMLHAAYLAVSFLLPCKTMAGEVSFNDHIRPIFTAKCTKCHGGAKADGDLSLIYRSEVLGTGKSGKRIIVPGKPDESELFRRIITDDLDDKMPLQKGDHADEPLTDAQVETVRKWIEQGAHWEDHWAYMKPVRPKSPALRDKSWVKTPMDQFVLARLEKKGIQPTQSADRAQWLRRASLDLIGLPPTLAELDAFLAARAPDAFEREVDRLLASPHFGERWAALWMDLARYSDTQGYEKDPHRHIWPYRNYLVSSFNADKPYDLFLREQLAGDLIPDTTSEQLVATAFHRNTQTNTEGGTDDEEFRVAAVIDRVNTTWTATQGLTFACVQCHAHPYEPIPHEDYYRFYDFFNSTEDADLNNDFPLFKVSQKSQDRQRTAEIYQKLPMLRRAINEPGRKLITENQSWEPLQYQDIQSTHGKLTITPKGDIRASGTFPPNTRYNLIAKPSDFTAIKVTILPEATNPAELPERGSVLSSLELHKIKADGSKEKIKLVYVFADKVTGPFDPLDSLTKSVGGFGGYPKLFGRREAVFVPTSPVTFSKGEQLAITLQNRASTTGNQACTVRRFIFKTSNNNNWTQLVNSPDHAKRVAAYRNMKLEYKRIPGTYIPVMRDRPQRAKRETRLFIGGLWLNKGKVYQPGVPKLLNGYQEKMQNRLDMANWLTSNKNPLTARVMANRLFSELFGRGVVETLGDFGSTGTKPNNQPLLDHLAVQFQTTYGWSIKSLLREMVLSATYRQDNKATRELAKSDPGNRWLARGPRNRLSAEMIRDHALLVSGLITMKQGGPSVMPPQPASVWQSVYSGAQWKDATGPDRYRRALYTYWKRTSPYPSMITFDAPSRDLCNAQRIVTNTPLHALTTLNDPVYLECSRAFAKRITTEGGDGVNRQITYGYLLATQQQASPRTLKLLTGLYHDLVGAYRSNPTEAKVLAGTPEQAAMTVTANTILNLDAALTK